MESLEQFLSQVSSIVWGWPMLFLLMGTHLYLTIRLRFPQRKVFKGIKISFHRDRNAKGDVSQFGALATSLAATMGTGNIVGVATAIALGGPGAVFWCWIMGVLGIATKYAEGLLAIKYRIRNSEGKYSGGPMFALERGLGMKWLAVLFAVFTILASFGIGDMVQSNTAAVMVRDTFHIPRFFTALFIVLLATITLIFGVRGIARVSMVLVPFMAVMYVGTCLYLIVRNHEFIPAALRLIAVSAFNPQAAGGGFVGFGVITAMRYGFARGLFSNESGMGSAPIIAAAAKTDNPVRQALVSSTSTFWDTVVVCAITGLTIVSTMLSCPQILSSDASILTKAVFDTIPHVGAYLLSFAIITFSLSTILGWSYYGEKAIEYLGGRRWAIRYRVVYVSMAFVGAIIEMNTVWNFSDIMNALMVIPNLVGVLLLSGVIVAETNKYLWSGHLEDKDVDSDK